VALPPPTSRKDRSVVRTGAAFIFPTTAPSRRGQHALRLGSEINFNNLNKINNNMLNSKVVANGGQWWPMVARSPPLPTSPSQEEKTSTQ
jgi:hypothetical protein